MARFASTRSWRPRSTTPSGASTRPEVVPAVVATSSRASRSVRSSVRSSRGRSTRGGTSSARPGPTSSSMPAPVWARSLAAVLAAAPDCAGCVALRARRAIRDAACRTRPRPPGRAPDARVRCGARARRRRRAAGAAVARRPAGREPRVAPADWRARRARERAARQPSCAAARADGGRMGGSRRRVGLRGAVAADRAAACACRRRGCRGISRRLARRRGALVARGARARPAGRRVRLHDHDRADGGSALDRVAAHLSRPRSGWFAARATSGSKTSRARSRSISSPRCVRRPRCATRSRSSPRMVSTRWWTKAGPPGSGARPEEASKRCGVAVGYVRRRR